MEASEQFVSKNYAESAIDAKFRAVNIDGAVERAVGPPSTDSFTSRPGTAASLTSVSRQVPEELIVIDLHPKNVSAGTKCQKQMAEMLTMVGGDEERQLGFRPAERQYTAKAWDHSIRFAENAEVEQTQSSLLNYSMLLIALLLVVVVVLKQVIPTPSHLLDRISPISSPFPPVVLARFHRLAEAVPTSLKPEPRAKRQWQGRPNTVRRPS